MGKKVFGALIAGAILVGATIIKNSNDGTTVVNNCVSTQSIRTGCLTPVPIP